MVPSVLIWRERLKSLPHVLLGPEHISCLGLSGAVLKQETAWVLRHLSIMSLDSPLSMFNIEGGLGEWFRLF